MGRAQAQKGQRTEELLRAYFLRLGFYTVRSIRVSYGDIDVTDLDLWLYLRPSLISRERINVDIKNRTSPKAMERIIWAKGMKEIFGLDRCIVATTDARSFVKEFGAQHNVRVLDGAFISRLSVSSNGSIGARYSEEEFIDTVMPAELHKSPGNWRARLSIAKSRLLTHLNLDGCNSLLEDMRYFAEQIISTADRRQHACRMLYLFSSFFLVCLDYSISALSFEDAEIRKSSLVEGFRFGARGRSKTEEVLRTAQRLIEAYAPDGRAVGTKIRANVLEDLSSMPVEILAEFFSRTEVARDLFTLARRMEQYAFDKKFNSPDSADPAILSLLGVLLDFFSLDRQRFFGAFETSGSSALGATGIKP